jgi:putative acetyltransferase
VAKLDEHLRKLNGELQSSYDQYNGLADIKDVVVAYDAGRPVGCASMKKHREDSYELKRVFVQPDYRSRGIARAMMARLESEAIGRKASSLILETGRTFEPAIRLYEGLGFEITENYGQYRGMAHSLCMRKTL